MAVVKRQLKNKVGGRPVFRFQVKWRYLGKGPIDQSRTLDNLKDAELLNKMLKESGWAYRDTDPEIVHLTLIGREAEASAEPKGDEPMTVAQAVKTWIDRPGLAPGTTKGYRTAAKHFKSIDKILVKDLTKAQVNKMFREVEDKGVSPNYLLTMRIVLNGSLAAAGRPGLTADTHYTGGREVVPYYLRPAQEEALIEAARKRCGDRLAAAIALTLACGLRWGETYGLRVRFIDLDERLLHIEQGINVGHKLEDGFHPKQLKTETSRRKVPIPEDVCELLRPLLEGLDPNAPAFFPERTERRPRQHRPGQRGMGRRPREFWAHRTFHYQWKRICELAEGVPNDLRYHDLRHTCAKRWLEAGVPIGIVSKMLGHSKIDVTHAEYGGFDRHSIDLMRTLVEAATPKKGRRLKAV